MADSRPPRLGTNSSNSKNAADGKDAFASAGTKVEDPDGKGFWDVDGYGAWLMCFGTFTSASVSIGLINSGGIILAEALDHWPDADFGQAAWIPGLLFSLPFLFSIVTGPLSERYPVYLCSLFGGLLSGACWVLSAQMKTLTSFNAMISLSGLGISFCHAPSFVMLNKHFDRKRTMANSAATSGIGLGTMLLAPTVTAFFQSWGWESGLRAIGCIMFCMAVFVGSLFALGHKYAKTVTVSSVTELETVQNTVLGDASNKDSLNNAIRTEEHDNTVETQQYSSFDPLLLSSTGGAKSYGATTSDPQKLIFLTPNLSPSLPVEISFDFGDHLDLEPLEEQLESDNVTAKQLLQVAEHVVENDSRLRVRVRSPRHSPVPAADGFVPAFTSEEELSGYDEAHKAVTKSMTLGMLLKDPVFLFFCISNTCADFSYMIPLSYVPEYVQYLGHDISFASLLFTVFGFSSFVGRFLGAQLIAMTRLTEFGLFSWSLFGLAVSMVILLFEDFAREATVLITFMVLLGFLSGSMFALCPSLLTQWFGINNLGRVLGLFYCVEAFPLLFAPPVSGHLFDSIDNTSRAYFVLFLLAGAVFLTGAIACVPIVLSKRHRLANLVAGMRGS
ncbi:MAG: hypothetical protein MHM6MM_004585 [Cercozoa sp. M6MM]